LTETVTMPETLSNPARTEAVEAQLRSDGLFPTGDFEGIAGDPISPSNPFDFVGLLPEALISP
ncbi:MAG: hypothetical protein OEO83_18845, partial [Alphaproteobacteria bacterium]|nr:hypothetical protein [Alphaproteobacteria bacterium]